MWFRFFTVNAQDPERDEALLNAFLTSHRVADVQWQWSQREGKGVWCARVELVGQLGGQERPGAPAAGKSGKDIDYRNVLSEDEFRRFSALRAWRKAIAATDGVQLFVVFTNEQLAELARRDVETLSELGEISGVGRARLERYGLAALEVLANLRRPATSPRPTGNGAIHDAQF